MSFVFLYVIFLIFYFQLLKDDATLYQWITTLEETGLCLLTGTPTTQGQINRIGERVAYLRKIHYG